MTIDDQRHAALRRANEVRSARSAMKRDLRQQSPADALGSTRRRVLAPPWWVQTMTIFDLLTALPRVGPSKARLTLASCQVKPRRRVGDLVPRERQALADWLEARAEELRERAAA